MDKETLSHYGWIVVLILILSVMIALASPFGNFIKTAIMNTTTALVDMSNEGFDVIGGGNGGNTGDGETGGDTGGDNTGAKPQENILIYEIYYDIYEAEDDMEQSGDTYYFHVYEHDPTHAFFNGNQGENATCGCEIGTLWNWNETEKTVSCPCGQTILSNPFVCDRICEHRTETIFVNNGNITHHGECNICNYMVGENVSCYDGNNDGICDTCNGEMVCNHPYTEARNEGLVHTYYCSDCGAETGPSVSHEDKKGTGFCSYCGAVIE